MRKEASEAEIIREVDPKASDWVGTSGCVESTRRDASMLDHYKVTLEDCGSMYWPDLHEAALESLGLLFGEARPSGRS